MKTTKLTLLVVVCIAFVTNSFAQQPNYAIRNGIGLQAGITKFDIITDNFETRANSGFSGGLAASVDIPHKWYEVSYNIQLGEHNIDINASPLGSITNDYVEYKIMTAQVSFLWHIKLLSDNLTLDFGPMVQYNSDLKLKDESIEDYIVAGYDNLLTKDITDISNFNLDGAIGLSAGINFLQLRAQYIYGFTNILGSLNNQDLNITNSEKFKGNQSMLVFSAILTF